MLPAAGVGKGQIGENACLVPTMGSVGRYSNWRRFYAMIQDKDNPDHKCSEHCQGGSVSWHLGRVS